MTPVPMTPAQNTELIKLIHQVNGHQISNLHTLLLGISMALPLSTTQKLSLYHWLSSLPLPELSPFQMTILFIIGPITLACSMGCGPSGC